MNTIRQEQSFQYWSTYLISMNALHQTPCLETYRMSGQTGILKCTNHPAISLLMVIREVVVLLCPRVSEEQKPFQNIKSDHKGITVQKRCVFSAGEHTSETCNMNKKSHNEKIDCLKAQGICFGCLTKGHLSKDCQKRMKCEVCSMKHPTILHIYKKKIEQKDNSDNYTQAASVSSRGVDSSHMTCTRVRLESPI